MRILQICKKYPYPLKDGESIAVASLAKGLTNLGCELSLLTMNTSKHFFAGSTPSFFKHYQNVYSIPVRNEVSYVGMAKNLLSKDSYHVSRLYSEQFKDSLIAILKENKFDIIQLETIFPAIYLPILKKYSKAKVIVRSHNVEHEIWDRIAANATFFTKWYLKECVRKLKNYENQVFPNLDAILAITPRDLEKIRNNGFTKPAISIPVGINKANLHPAKPIHSIKNIGFIGALDWMPNLEGLFWFLKNCWPKIHESNPDLVFNIAGSNYLKSPSLLEFPGVHFHGEVPDSKAFISAQDVLVVPLFSGSGIRIKILEAMAMGKVVISTRIGFEGIEVEPNRHLLEANSIEDFRKSIDQLLENPKRAHLIGKKAEKLMNEKYDQVQIAKKLHTFYLQLLNSKRTKVLKSPPIPKI